MPSRHVEWYEPQLQPAWLILMEGDGTEIVRYNAPRSFHHIDRDGRRFRLNGRDRATGEMIFLPEVEMNDA